MRVRRLWLADWRSYGELELELAPGVTVLTGANGEGKTNLVEALAFLATLESFRGAPAEALVRAGTDRAVVRAEVLHDDGRELLVEAELPRQGRLRVQVNRQRLARAGDLLGVLRITVFSPDDLVLVKGPPAERRRYLDDALVALAPRFHALRADVDRILRHRAALLRRAGGRLTDDAAFTLDVWDAKLVSAGEELARARVRLVTDLEPLVERAVGRLAGRAVPVAVRYEPPWLQGGLAAALASSRDDDVRRQATGVGPHRDELDLGMDDRPARTQASQGEQRTLALALRLAVHDLVADRTGSPPVLLLDDVLSELDPSRSAALLAHLPPGQVLVTTASGMPPGAPADRVLHLVGGRLAP